MFCQKCGKEVEENVVFCPACGHKIAKVESGIKELNEETIKGDEKGKYVDKEGFIRKPREVYGIFIWIIAGIIGRLSLSLPSEYGLLALVFGLVSSICIYLAIKMYSSHDIGTWKHSTHVNLWIFVGCLFGFVGIFVYYYLKSKERKYLTETQNQYLNMS